MRRPVSFCAAAACCAIAALAQSTGFEVASIRLNIAPQPTGGGSESGPPPPPPPPIFRPSPTGVIIENASVHSCLMWALGTRGWQIAGPDWIRNNRYNISAKTGAAVPEDQLKSMVARLLTERFRFEIRRETKETQVLGLVVAPGGSKLEAGDPEKAPSRKFAPIPGGGLRLVAENSAVDIFEQILSFPMWPPIVNRSGLTGVYNFTYERPGRDPQNPDAWLSDIQSALRKQVGLSLAPQKAAVETVTVVGGSEKPTENE